MPAPGKHRDAIVAAALTLFRRRGYSGTGLNDIVAMSGAPKGSLYHYFPNGKASIAEAAVRRASANVIRTLSELVRSKRAAGAVVRGYAELVAGWLQKSKFSDGGPITTVLLEMAPGDLPITKAGREAFQAWKALIAGLLIEEGLADGRADTLATLALAAIEGSLVQARVERSAAPILAVGRELEAVFASAAGGRSKRKPHS